MQAFTLEELALLLEAERTLFFEREAALDATRIKKREARIKAKKAREVQDRVEKSKFISVYI